MRINEPQPKVDVFEMILDSMNDPSAYARAKPKKVAPEPDMWDTHENEGQLAVDVLESGDSVIAVSTMAGARPDKIEVFVHNDILTIRGERRRPVAPSDDTKLIHSECFWGKFSRTVVLPVDVDGASAEATYRHGVLTISIKKQVKDTRIQITVVDE